MRPLCGPAWVALLRESGSLWTQGCPRCAPPQLLRQYSPVGPARKEEPLCCYAGARKGGKGGREGVRNQPSARRSLLCGHVLPPVPMVGETVTQATQRGRHEHLRCPGSGRRVHPTSPVSCCPWLDDSECLLPLRNAAIPTVRNTIWSTGPSVPTQTQRFNFKRPWGGRSLFQYLTLHK